MPTGLRPGTTSTGNVVEVLTGLDTLAPYGARTDHPKLKAAREAAERVRELRESNATIRAQASGGAQAALHRIAGQYARGELAPEDVAERVGNVAALANGKRELDTALARAEAVASAPGIEACRKLGDAWVTEVIRPAVERVLDELVEVAEPAWEALNLPADRLKHDRLRSHALDRARDAVATLDMLRDYATSLRNAGWVPTPGRPGALGAEIFGWRRHDKLAGELGGDYLVYFMRNYLGGAEPGAWTGDEVLDTLDPGILDDAEPPKPPRGGDAHYANGGRREVA